LKQRFMKTCGYQVDNRDLSEYFAWILDPARLDRMMGMGKLTASKNYLRVEQIQGAIYVQRFYNEVIRRRDGIVLDTENKAIKRLQAISDEIHEAFDFIAESYDTNVGIILSMARYGFPLVLQFMVERHGMSEGQARKRIVDNIKEFVRDAEKPDKAVKFMDKAMESSKTFEFTYNRYTIWKEWKEKCEGLIEEAVEKAKTEKT